MRRILSVGFLAALVLSGCVSNNRTPSHLPTIWDIPGMIGSEISDAIYTQRRERVSAYVQTHYAAIRAEALRGGGVHLDEAMRIAQVKPDNQAKVRQELQTNHALYFKPDNNPEPVVVVLMVHSV